VVSWAQDGIISGTIRDALKTTPGSTGSRTKVLNIADAAIDSLGTSYAGLFTINGSVDAEITTRVQYHVPHNQSSGGGGWEGRYARLNSDVVISGVFNWTSGDVTAATTASQGMVATVFLVPDTVDGVRQFTDVPSPTRLLAVGADPLSGSQVFRSPDNASVAGNNAFEITIPSINLAPNTKYWALLAPCFFNPFTTPSFTNDIPRTPVDTKCRALSFWTNRTPLAPTITSPDNGTLVTAGEEITFSFTPNDPDALPDAPDEQFNWSFADLAGVQVQYAAQPTEDDPTPTWTDLPIVTMSGDMTVGDGWFIENSDSTLPQDGAEALRNNRTMKIICGSSLLKVGQGNLPSGQWQLRVRTFDYGHSMTTVRQDDVSVPPNQYAVHGYGPLGTRGPLGPVTAAMGPFPATNYTPDTFPAENTSPWSEPVNLTIATQVPPPTLTSPINRNAIPVNVPVTLRWKYRNTHRPPNPQAKREVQIRKVGDLAWTTLVSGNQTDEFYDIATPAANLADPPAYPTPVEYFADGGFEGGTLDGWQTTSVNGLTNHNYTGSGQPPHSGNRALVLNPVSAIAPVIYHYFDFVFPPAFYTLEGWVTNGNAGWVIVQFMFTNLSQEAFPPETGRVVMIDGSPGWQRVLFENVPVPLGATQALISVNAVENVDAPDPATDVSEVWLDDWSLRGSLSNPVDPPVYPADVIVDQAPITYTLEASFEYEWRVRVADSAHVTSEWSDPSRFWIVPQGSESLVPAGTIDGGTLGCGTHRVEIYRRGGLTRVGEITQVSYVDWSRVRDDISDAKIVVSGWDVDCGELLKDLQTWAYEVVIFRDNGISVDRVWEGPITLLSYENNQVTINAKDVMAYVYRRIIKQAMNDSGAVGGDTVTNRATRILQNVLAPDDPNLLRYLTTVYGVDDATEYRNLPPYSRTAFEEIDDMAANAGLDYAAVGRAILVWGTKNPLGVLPEFRDENLGSSPIVSEYGMSMANLYSVSDGNGVHGEANRLDADGEDPSYGLVEMLSSSWASDSQSDTGTYTQAGLATVEASFAEFAERSIASRYPPPVIVRIPDNTTVHPNTVISIQHLVPGVVVPLRSTSTLRTVTGNQKLDSVKVVEVKGVETVSITLSPFNHELEVDGP